MGWIDAANDAGVLAIARALGLDVRERGDHGGAFGPCPACGAARRHPSRHDKRPAIGVRSDGAGWRCHECNVSGDAADLAALGTSGGRVRELPEHRREDVRRWVLERFGSGATWTPASSTRPTPAAPAPRSYTRPPAEEVRTLWGASLAVDRTIQTPDPSDLDAGTFLARRGYWPADVARLDLARLLPLPESYAYPAWWPSSWARTWRLVVPAYEADGAMASLHARAVVLELARDQPKTRWPRGVDAGALVFADARGLAFLRGEARPERVYLYEGITDYIAGALWIERTGRNAGALGLTSGGAEAFKRMRWPAEVPCYVATDADKDGDKYAAAVRAALPAAVTVRRIELPEAREEAA